MDDQQYTVGQLARISGVSVRSLHLYDEIGLLRPMERTAAGYRLYGTAELLRLQQILLYRQLDFPLLEIGQILDQPGFDLIRALEMQKGAFQTRRESLDVLLQTIDQTIHYLKSQGMMSNLEFLYQGIPKETAEAWRHEAAGKWGEDAVRTSEQHLQSLGRPHLEQLKKDAADIGAQLFALRDHHPADPAVQMQIGRHYANIRAFWGTTGSKDLQGAAYAGLGELYIADERYLMRDGVPQPEFARFMSQAMAVFASQSLGV